MPEWPSYCNFRKVTQNPHFLKKCKGGTKGNFSKIAQKVALVWKAQKHSGANNIIFYLVCTSSAKTAKDFGAKSDPKVPQKAKLWQFLKGHPKPAFSKKVQRGDQGKFLKNGPRLKGLKALWRKWHYPSIRLDNILAQKVAPKVLEWPSYGNFGNVTQNPHFQKKERRGNQMAKWWQFFARSPKDSIF